MRRALILGCALALLAAAPAPAAKVTTMVVGKERVLRDAKEVRLKERRVKVGRRRCTVARGTPLAVLASLRLSYRVRDYGSCGRRTRDSGGLFVTRIGSERNRGQDGWVYKTGRRTGSGGAGDKAGPFGTGRRLRGGDRLLWFWCDKQSSGSCQRTLEAKPDRTTAAPGETVNVTVRGYDDFGRGVRVAGATVTLGSATALSGPDGVATLPVAETGRLELEATAAGMVRAFPGEVRSG